LPKELTQINEKGENVIFCPYCGTQITLKNDVDENEVDKTPSELSTETKETKEVKFSLTDKEIRHIIRIFIYRNIYQMIKQKKSVKRRLIFQKDIPKSQISYLTSKIRNTLLKTSNPVQGAPQELTNPTIRKFNTFYKKFTSSLNDKKASREKYSQLLAENIEFIYNLIRGDYTFEDLSESKRKIVLDLKEFFGYKEESQSKRTVNYNVSLFLAIKIYFIIKQNKDTHLNKSAIDEIINNITDFVIHNDFHYEFLNNLEIYQKRSLASFLKEFKFNITYDWVYRTSFQDHVFKLIYLVNQLFCEKDYLLNLTGSDKLIAEGLLESSLFQNDCEFSAYFRLNLTIILCRIIHKIMQDSPDIPQDVSNQPNLNPSLKQELLEYLLKEITALKNINFEFLEKFYKLSLEEFQTKYQKFQIKLASDMIYYHNFREYLGKLIKIVYTITHSIQKKSKLTKIERVVINDLANYNFRWNQKNREIKNYFWKKELKLVVNSDSPSKDTQKFVNYFGLSEDNKIKRFPKKTRNVIAGFIYELLSKQSPLSNSEITDKIIDDLFLNNCYPDVIKKIPKKQFNELVEKLRDREYKTLIYDYFEDLIKVVIELKKFNEKNEDNNPIRINSFVDILIKKDITLNQSKRAMKSTISDFLDYLNSNYEKFEITKIVPQTLYDNGIKKECGRCHQIKPYKEFNKRGDSKSLKSTCKECILAITGIKTFRNKIRIIERLGGRCHKCKEDINKLPVLTFHHPNKDLKTFNYGHISNRSFNRIISKLKHEKVVLLCSNCHSKEQTKIFNIFKEIIIRKDIFHSTPDQIHKQIMKFIKNHSYSKNKKNHIQSSYKRQIIRWLKKRYIIENLYGGTCIGCGEVSINDLPVYDIHHRLLNNEDNIRWNGISNFSCSDIAELLIKENCVMLCSNCHQLIHATRFIANIDEIFDESSLKLEIRGILNVILTNIQSFRFPNIKIEDLFIKEIPYGEAWKNYLITINDIIKGKGENIFTNIEIADKLGVIPASVDPFLRKLRNMKLVILLKRNINTPSIYALTENGKDFAKKL